MGEVRFMISEAAKQVKVESHVLRYWEEELNLEIGRTEMGHRYYTKDDIQLFRCIKKLKDEGMLLKDLKPLIPELRETRLKLQKSTDQEPVKAKSSEKPAKPEEKAASSAIKKAVFSNSSSQKKGAGQAGCLSGKVLSAAYGSRTRQSVRAKGRKRRPDCSSGRSHSYYAA